MIITNFLLIVFTILILLNNKNKSNRTKKDIIFLSTIMFFSISFMLLFTFILKSNNPLTGIDSYIKDALKLSYKY